ncbi:MAG: hypothetical protein IPP22_00475 [Nitrosomonas sp.]|nr:hypothetical protein [Nitrosomonas sp.]
MNTKLMNIKYIAGLFAGICTVLVPGMGVTADWSLKILDQGATVIAMNDSGQVVGYNWNGVTPLGAYITGPNGTGITYLDDLDGGVRSGRSYRADHHYGQVVRWSFQMATPSLQVQMALG